MRNSHRSFFLLLVFQIFSHLNQILQLHPVQQQVIFTGIEHTGGDFAVEKQEVQQILLVGDVICLVFSELGFECLQHRDRKIIKL